MNRSLDEMFALLAGDGVCAAVPQPALQGDLFGMAGEPPRRAVEQNLCLKTDLALFSSGRAGLSALPNAARRLFELSVNAFDAFVQAWMSERPIEAAALRFGKRVLSARDRQDAERLAAGRGDSDALAVLEASYKVWHETHRLLGFLRFRPAGNGLYIARCAPDHFTLPALAEHFSRRFGETPWAIIDEKRGLCLCRLAGTPPKLCAANATAPLPAIETPRLNDWENLWKQYHKTISIESRNNPELQGRFIPKRYRKYLPEL
jgi:probable DNA metabolism protein